MRIGIALAALLAGPSAAASAQPPSPPDPATVALPDMTPTRDRGVIRDGWRHFYFHKAGVSYPQAYADFADCYRFLPTSDMARSPTGALPMFRPWTAPVALGPGPERQAQLNNYGVIGAVIGGMVAGPLERRRRQSRMRRCLEPRGYVRYPLREEVWRLLIDNYSPRSIAMQAKAASGPAPGLEPVAR